MKRKLSYDSDNVEDSLNEETDSPKEEITDEWSMEELQELLRTAKEFADPDESHKYDTTLKKIDWNQFEIGNHSSEDAKAKLDEVLGHIRKYRTLSEILVDAMEWVKNPKRNAEAKKMKYADKPKRPLSSYMIFFKENKDKLMLGGQTDIITCSKILGQQYQALNEKKKNKYLEKARVARVKYEEEMEAFFEKHPEARNTKSRSAKKKKILPPRNAFTFFYQAKLKKHGPDVSKTEMRETCQVKWKKLSDKKKSKYIHKALEDEERYKKELEEYRAKHPQFTPCNLRSNITKEDQAILSRLSGRPTKPPASGYNLFCQEKLTDQDIIEGFSTTERMSHISKLWKNLTAEEKQIYHKKATKLQDDYKSEFAKFVEGLPEEKRKEEMEKFHSRPKSNAEFNEYFKQSLAAFEKKHPGVNKQKLRGIMWKEFEALPVETKNAYQKKTPRKLKRKETLFKGEPEQPPGSLYGFFMQKFLHKNTQLDPQTRMKEAPKIWRSLTNEDKQKYEAKYLKARKDYLDKYTQFVKGLCKEELEEFTAFKNLKSDGSISLSAKPSPDTEESENEEIESDYGSDED